MIYCDVAVVFVKNSRDCVRSVVDEEGAQWLHEMVACISICREWFADSNGSECQSGEAPQVQHASRERERGSVRPKSPEHNRAPSRPNMPDKQSRARQLGSSNRSRSFPKADTGRRS